MAKLLSVGVDTYSDWVMQQVDVKTLLNSKASFYDVTANIIHKINENNRLSPLCLQ